MALVVLPALVLQQTAVKTSTKDSASQLMVSDCKQSTPGWREQWAINSTGAQLSDSLDLIKTQVKIQVNSILKEWFRPFSQDNSLSFQGQSKM